jgi:hypothetical protein
MAQVRIQYGSGNVISRNIGHTDEIGPDVYRFFGASPENTVRRVRGVDNYSGPLVDGDLVDLQQRANSKQ